MSKYRKVLAAILAATMVLGSGVVANAAEGSGSGSGDLDIVENLEIFNVILPTTSAEEQFNYILDPTGVIQETNAEKYGATASNFTGTGNMFFKNKKATASDPQPYTNESDPINAYNKSNIAVDIKVKAEMSTSNGITIATSSVAGDTTTDPKLYFAVKNAADSKETPITVAGIEATSSIATATNAYETKYVDGKYVKTLIAAAKDLKPEDANFANYFAKYSFTLTGDCNPKGAWRTVKAEDLPTVNLVWTIDKPDGASGVTDGPKMTVSAAGLITVTGLTADKSYAALKIKNSNGGPYDINDAPVTWDLTNYNADDGTGSFTCQLEATWLSTLRGATGEAILELSDGTEVKTPINIPAA